MDNSMRCVFLAAVLSIALIAPVGAQPAKTMTPARLAQIKTKFLNDCYVQLSASAEGSRHSDAKRRTFCGCVWPHLLRVHRNEAKDFVASKQFAGSMGEKMYIAERDCMAKANMWPAHTP
jgi:hypothetical protein